MKIRTAFVAALALVAAVAVTGCGHLMMMMHGKDVARPAESEFGTGPRASAARQFTATLQPDQLKPEKADQSRPRKNRGRLSLAISDRGRWKPSAAVWLANSCQGLSGARR